MRQNDIVIGALYGDEGKGKTVQYLCEATTTKKIVARYDAGHQVGHTCFKDGIFHEFHHFGSGTLVGVPTYWHKNCTIYPPIFMEELEELKQMGHLCTIFFHPKCPITTPFDIIKNFENQAVNQHGTTGLGVGQTKQREQDLYHLQLEDLFFGDAILEQKLRSVWRYYNQESGNITLGDEEAIRELISEVYNPFIELFDESNIKIRDETVLTEYNQVIFEGSQGLLLDKHSGIFPHVTHAHTNENPAIALLGPNEGFNVHYVMRAYLTRHGNGPLLNENEENSIMINPDETNTFNENQGEFRRAYLNLQLLKYALTKNMDALMSGKVRVFHFYINCLDHLQDYCLYDEDGFMIEFDSEIALEQHLVGRLTEIYRSAGIPVHIHRGYSPESVYS